MLMLAAHNAHERSVANFESLFQQVSPGGFRLVGVTSGTEVGAFQSLLEFEFVGASNNNNSVSPVSDINSSSL
jgi:6-hydroxytryprostatin B O-methyltransferase